MPVHVLGIIKKYGMKNVMFIAMSAVWIRTIAEYGTYICSLSLQIS
jgi:hypothetical protein